MTKRETGPQRPFLATADNLKALLVEMGYCDQDTYTEDQKLEAEHIYLNLMQRLGVKTK